MADNFPLNLGSGGITLAAQDESSVFYQEVKLTASGSGTTEALSKAEDSAHASGNHGIMALTVRQDTAAALGDTDADYQPFITDANGRLHVLDANTAAIKTAVEIIDNAVSGNEMLIAGGATQTNDLKVTLDSEAVVLGAGAAAIGKLTANDGVDIGDVTLNGPLGGGVEAGALLVTLANDSTGLVSIDDNGGSLTIDNDDTVSTNNSTTATLTSASTFTGPGDDCLGYSTVTIQLDASHDSATDGMTFQFSVDNSNWDDIYPFTYTASDGARRFQFPVQARYFRVVYTNGGTNQTHFRVQTILHRQNITTSIHRLVDDESPDLSALIVKAAILAQAAGSGDFMAVQATAGGNLKVSIEEFNGSTLGGGPEAGALLVTIANDSTGLLSIDDNGGSLTVDSGAAFTVQENGAALTALQLIDDPVVVLGTATYTETSTKGNMIGVVRNDDLATLGDTDNEIVPLQANVSGSLYTEAAMQVDYCFDGGIQTTIKRVSGLAASGTTAMVAAVASRKIRILALSLIATATTVTNVYVANADNDILGDASNPIPLAMDADGDNVAGLVLPFNPGGWAETDTVNEALNLILSAAQDVIYALTYLEVA